MLRFLLLLIFLFNNLLVTSQIDVLEGEASIDWLSSISEDDIKKQVREKAILNGIEKKYGQVILQGNSTYVKNLTNGLMVESQSVFYSSSQSLLKGEFLRQLGEEKYEVFSEKIKVNGSRDVVRRISCKIVFEAREAKEIKPAFNSYATACDSKPINCRTTNFYNKDNFYLYLKSPSSGYFSVFADYEVEGKHYCSRYLPIAENGLGFEKGLPVNAGLEYIFFSKNVSVPIPNFKAQEMLMITNELMEYMRFFLVFSENELISPPLAEIPVSELYKKQNKGLSLPEGIRSEKFQEWLYQQRAFNNKFSHQVLDIKIQKFKE